MESLSSDEQAVARIAEFTSHVQAFFETTDVPDRSGTTSEWLQYLSQLKATLGNYNDRLSELGCLLAKEYLDRHLPMNAFSATAKSQSANGLDIDASTVNGERVIGEVKTTTPLKQTRFGAKQYESVLKDLTRLDGENALHKFMFVINQNALQAIEATFPQFIERISIVCLLDSGTS